MCWICMSYLCACVNLTDTLVALLNNFMLFLEYMVLV